MELFVSAFIVALGIGAAWILLPAFIGIAFLGLMAVVATIVKLFERGN